MALQGDLDSFALPDVLRLLAGTTKTGRLAVTSAGTDGEMWLLDGDLVGGRVDAAPHATRPADVVFELIRLHDGSFVFDEGERLVDGADRSPVDEAIATAQDLVVEWAEVESVVPTIQAPVRLVAELDGESVTVGAGQWRILAAIGDDTTVRSLGDRFELTDLVVSRQVKDLVEAGLAELDEAPATAVADEVAEAGPVDDPDEDEAAAAAMELEPASEHEHEPVAEENLSILRPDEAPVLLEDSDDAHLPEPLPGAGTTFGTDLDELDMDQPGTVDGRSFEAFDAPAEGNEAEDADEDRDSLMRFLSTVEP